MDKKEDIPESTGSAFSPNPTVTFAACGFTALFNLYATEKISQRLPKGPKRIACVVVGVSFTALFATAAVNIYRDFISNPNGEERKSFKQLLKENIADSKRTFNKGDKKD